MPASDKRARFELLGRMRRVMQRRGDDRTLIAWFDLCRGLSEGELRGLVEGYEAWQRSYDRRSRRAMDAWLKSQPRDGDLVWLGGPL